MAGGSVPYGVRIDRAAARGETGETHAEIALPSREAAPRTRSDDHDGMPRGEMPEALMERLFKSHHAAIWRVLRRLGVPSALLDDAAQEVFWVAARKLVEIRPGSEQAFLYGIALRIASQEHRRRRRAPQPADVEVLARLRDLRPSPEEELEQRRARVLLDVVLDRMAIELRTVFVLCELEELEVRDAAALEGIPVGTASSRLRKAREEFSAIAKRVRATLMARGSLP